MNSSKSQPTRDMADIFDRMNDPEIKLRKEYEDNKEERMDKTDIGITDYNV